jgi:hypothetical protein
MPVDFRAKQHEFTRYIRDPDNPTPSDIKPERMAMYRELIYNNIEGFIASNFPVIRKILADGQWHALIQDFILHHHAHTPYFAEIAEEFLEFLEKERNNADDPPFMLELAHYEWMELALSVAQDNEDASLQKREVALENTLKLSSLACLLLYQFPVHRIAPEYLPEDPPEQPSTLIAHRDCNDEVKFIEVNPITYRLLEIIQEQGEINVLACLEQVAKETQHPDPELIISGGLQALRELAQKGVVYCQ